MPRVRSRKRLDVTPVAGESPMTAVERFLGPKRGILVLDNFEHLLAAAPLVSDLLAACPGLRVLATSREALQLHAEHRYAVSPLQVPEDGAPEAVAQASAGALFVERAHSRDRAFELTAGQRRGDRECVPPRRRAAACGRARSSPHGGARTRGAGCPSRVKPWTPLEVVLVTPPPGSGRCAPRWSGAIAC